MSEEGVPSEVDLHGFIDGELPPDRQAQVARFIESNPEIAGHVSMVIADKSAIAHLAEALLSQPVPARLSKAALRPPVRPATSRGRWAAGLGAVALAASLLLALLLREGSFAVVDPLIAQAMAARDGAVRPAHQVAFAAAHAASDADKVVSAALGMAVRAPDLSHIGFSLVAADIFDRGDGHALQLRYRDPGGRLFTVFVRPGHGPDRFALAERHGTRFCIWENEDASIVMAGAMPVSELFRLSSIVYAALAL